MHHSLLQSFDKHVAMVNACLGYILKVPADMAFHSCDGNVADGVRILLPKWVEEATDARGVWFLDCARGQVVNREYLLIGADLVPFLPGATRRAPVQEYAEFVKALFHAYGGGRLSRKQGFRDPDGRRSM